MGGTGWSGTWVFAQTSNRLWTQRWSTKEGLETGGGHVANGLIKYQFSRAESALLPALSDS